MARSLRIEYPGAWYHVTCRGNEKREIFSDDKKQRGQVLKIDECVCVCYTWVQGEANWVV